MTPIYINDAHFAMKLGMGKPLFKKDFNQPSNNKDEKESMDYRGG